MREHHSIGGMGPGRVTTPPTPALLTAPHTDNQASSPSSALSPTGF